jgi:hypothetical protein
MSQYPGKHSLKVFISSTAIAMPEHRTAVLEACLRIGAEPLLVEDDHFSELSALDRSQELLDRADVYVGIFGFRYGLIQSGHDKSLGELEYDNATAKGLPLLLYLMSDDHPVKAKEVETGPGADKLRALKARIRKENLCKYFGSSAELKANVVTDLLNFSTASQTVSKPTNALLVMPHGGEHDRLRRVLSQELESQGAHVLRPDDRLEAGADWVTGFGTAVRAADLVVIDVSEASPFVMYELGLAHALKKPAIMLSDTKSFDSLPPDLKGFLYLTYEQGDFEPLRKPFGRLVREYVREGRR